MQVGDTAKRIEFEVAFTEGKDKTLSALAKRIKADIKTVEKAIIDGEKKLNEAIEKSDKTSAKEARTGIKEQKTALRELSTEYKKLLQAVALYRDESKISKQEQIKFQKDFNALLKKENDEIREGIRLRKAERQADEYQVRKNRQKTARERRFAARIERGSRYQVMRDELADIQINRKRNAYEDQFQGQYSTVEEGRLERRARDQQLQRMKGAKSNLGADYFAEDGSIVKLKNRLDELRGLRDLKAPGSAGFKSLSGEINSTEKELGRLTNRMNGDGMASFRKFSHMVFNLTGLFFVASRGFQGLVQTLTRGAEFETMRQAFQGTTQDIENMQKASRGLLSLEKIFAFSNKASDLGIKIKDQPIFIDMAIRSMKAYGGGVEKLDEILEKVIKSTETAQKELSSLGIKKVDFKKKVNDLSQELVQNNEKYSLVNASLEKSKKVRKDYLLELDAEDQKMVKVKALLDLYGKSLEDVTNVQLTTPDKILSINAQWDNFTNIMAQRLLPVANTVFPLITGFLDAITSSAPGLVAALSSITAGLAGLSVFFFTSANPLGGLAAALVAVVAAIATFKTAFPDTQTQLDSSVSRLIMSVKDLRGEYEALGSLYEKVGGVATAQQQALIDKTQALIDKNKERLEQENQLSKFLTEARVRELESENRRLESKATVFTAFRDKKATSKDIELANQMTFLDQLSLSYLQTSGSVEEFNSKIADTKDKMEQNKKAIEDFYRSFDQRTLVSLMASNFKMLGKGTQSLTEHLINGTASVITLRNAMMGLGQEGTLALYGINKAAADTANSLGNILKAIGLQLDAAKVMSSGAPNAKEMSEAMLRASNQIIENARIQFPIKEEKLPANTTTSKGRKEKDKAEDLDTVDEKLKLILDKYKVWKDRQEAMSKLLDNMSELSKQGVQSGSALDYMSKILNPTEGELKMPQAFEELLKLQNEEIQNVQKNSKEELTDEQRKERIWAVERKISEARTQLLNDQLKIKEKITEEDIAQLEIAKDKVSFEEAIKRVGDSMRDASKDWNPGIKNVMTFFEMAEIGVHSLAETITGELGQAWDNVFGEANSLFEKFMKNVTTKILEALITRGIGLLLSVLFPGVGTILGAGLNAAVGAGGPSGGGGRLGASISPTFNPPVVQPIVQITGTMDGQKFFSNNAVVYYKNKREANVG